MMTPKKNSPPKKEKGSNPATEAKKNEHAGKINQRKIDQTGLTSRVRGHVSARGKRSQAKRDSR